MYDFIIIGGGISGLMMAYRLSFLFPQKTMMVIEKKGRFGGRIKTFRNERWYYDTGALRISNQHSRVMNLIKNELRLEKIPVPEQSTLSLSTWIERLQKECPFSADTLKNISIKTLYQMMYPHQPWCTLFESEQYQTMLTEKNAYDVFLHYSENYVATSYFTVNNGLETIISTLVNRLQQRKNVHLERNMEIQNIHYSKTDQVWKLKVLHTTHDIRHLKTKLLFVCLPPYNVIRLFPALQYITEIIGANNYMRIYAYGKQGSPFGYQKTHFPDLYQISYTDGSRAMEWLQKLRIMDNTVFQQYLKDHHFATMEWYQCHYWKRGTHYWKIGTSSEEYFPHILQPNWNEPLYLSNEAYSTYQAWIEGSLESVECCLRLYLLNTQSIERPFQMTGNKTMHSTIVKYRNEYFDIGPMIDRHPGGLIIRIGLTTDITKLFDTVEHSPMALQWLFRHKIM